MTKKTLVSPALKPWAPSKLSQSFMASLIMDSEIKRKSRHPGHMRVSLTFPEAAYQGATEYRALTCAIFYLLERVACSLQTTYIKFTIGYEMGFPRNKSGVTTTMGRAIPLFDTEGHKVRKEVVFAKVERLVRAYGEKYETAVITGVFLNIYFTSKDEEKTFPASFVFPRQNFEEEKIYFDRIGQIVSGIDEATMEEALPPAKSLGSGRARISSRFTSIKKKARAPKEEPRPFLVADVETLLVSETHVPYAAGYLVVRPGEEVTIECSRSKIKTFFSEGGSKSSLPSFADRSREMFNAFLDSLEECVRKEKLLRTAFLHNLSKFDGILFLNHCIGHDRYLIRPLMRNRKIYELRLYDQKNRLLIRFRDSLLLLPGKLEELGRVLCPQLGPKGQIPHETLKIEYLLPMKSRLLSYLRQDIRLLGGVMEKAQGIFREKFDVELEEAMTISALSLKIFRSKYLNAEKFHIEIPTRNVDSFIRRGYFGGHVDVYQPYGENLYLYDTNSLFPAVMQTKAMPLGKSVWLNNLQGAELDSLFGFYDALIHCPDHIDRPLLGYRGGKDSTLKFPTGDWYGNFFSEELKYARDLGYRVIPLRGRQFEKQEGVFKDFVTDLYDCRVEAKKAQNAPLAFIFKLVLNALYGRMGLHPDSTLTEICKTERFNKLLKSDAFKDATWLNDDFCLVELIKNSFANDDWRAPTLMAVQLSAAITSYARIFMHPFFSRSDCYYGDTDSIVLSSPLPEELVSETEIGKFKQEARIKQGFFLAPKSYLLITEDDKEIIKFKGAGKAAVTAEFLKKAYQDPTIEEIQSLKASFRIDWQSLNIVAKERKFSLGLPEFTKRERIYNEKGEWVNTKPIKIVDVD